MRPRSPSSSRHSPPPKGPKGRYEPAIPTYRGIWNFSANTSAAKNLITYLLQRSSVEQLVTASQGLRHSALRQIARFKVWAEQGPPKGTIYNSPPRSADQILSIAAAPAPPKIAVQIYIQATMPKMIAHCTQQRQSVDAAIAWAADELEGFMRG